MVNPPRRLVARSIDTSELIPAIQFRGAQETLKRTQNEIRNRFGLALPTVEPEFHFFSSESETVAAALKSTPADTPEKTLRCVVEAEQDSFTAHGTSARPVVLIQVGDQPKGWRPSPDDVYDVIVGVPASGVKHLLVDLFLDFSMSSSPHLQYVFDSYINKFGFPEYAKRKGEFARSRGLTQTPFGPVSPELGYANLSSLTSTAEPRDLERLIRLWESFALDPAFRDFTSIELAVESLCGRRKIGSKLKALELRQALEELESGAYAIVAFIPDSQPTRDAFKRAKSFVEEMDTLQRYAFREYTAIMRADDLWDEYKTTRRELFLSGYITIERFILQR